MTLLLKIDAEIETTSTNIIAIKLYANIAVRSVPSSKLLIFIIVPMPPLVTPVIISAMISTLNAIPKVDNKPREMNGIPKGICTLNSVLNLPAPSICAASIIDFSVDLKALTTDSYKIGKHITTTTNAGAFLPPNKTMNRNTNVAVGAAFKKVIIGVKKLYKTSLLLTNIPRRNAKAKETENPITNLSIENPKYRYVDFLPKSSNISLKVLYGEGKIMLFKSTIADTKNQTPIKNRNPKKNIKYLLCNTFISKGRSSKDC